MTEDQSAPAPAATQAPAQSANAPKKSNTCLIIAIILIAILVIAGIGGYFVYKKGFSAVKNAVTKSTLNPVCKYNDPDLCKFLNNWKTVKYFTANSTSTFEGKQINSIIKSVDPDRFQMTNLSGGKEDFNMITIGNTYYTKDYSDNMWVKTVMQQESAQIKAIEEEFDYDIAEDKTEYKKIGKEACGKLNCFKYQVIDPTITELNSKEYILFDDGQYLLRKTITEGPDNNLATSEFDYSKINITEPSPIKESNTSSVPNAAVVATKTSAGNSNSSSSSTDQSTQSSAEDQPTDSLSTDSSSSSVDYSGDWAKALEELQRAYDQGSFDQSPEATTDTSTDYSDIGIDEGAGPGTGDEELGE